MGSWIQGATGFKELQSLGTWFLFNASTGQSISLLAHDRKKMSCTLRCFFLYGCMI